MNFYTGLLRPQLFLRVRCLPPSHGMAKRPVRLRCLLTLIAASTFGISLASPDALAQQLTLDLGDTDSFAQQAFQLIALITVLALAPSILIMVTSFTRIVVVLSIVRAALGTPTSPPNSVIVALSLFLTAFVMAPTFEAAYRSGVAPLVAGEINSEEAFEHVAAPFRRFMESNVRAADYALFTNLAHRATADEDAPEREGDFPPSGFASDEPPLHVLVPAFMISELRRAFEIGFVLFLPFVIIDLVVASVLMSMGMMMLPPVMISLPFKLIFFVLVDGWGLLAGSLIKSFNT